ncbi:hypothetical protein PVK06_002420 [Gossypium arboreum]|uniref:Uncharacterized protein n=1 Tax=Gossypium arboreum TaxID=29729 RepID=A0ABR0R3P4_GOSAR|nr:hypothetical protein PVK06_002420 [Gossypium arboreum]
MIRLKYKEYNTLKRTSFRSSKEMCQATQPNKIKIGGCLSLLQSWDQFCFSFFTSSSGPPVYIPTLNKDLTIQAVILDEFLQNPNIWHIRVPLVNYTTVEMHQIDSVLRQFGLRQTIPVALEVLDDEYKIDLC